MFPVADDFAAIARRLKEIEAEVAKERAAKEPLDAAEDRGARDLDYMMYDDMSVCG